MTLIIGLGTADGIVLGIDTRFTYSKTVVNVQGVTEVHHSYMDGGHKVLLSHSHSKYGIAYLGQIHQGQGLLTPELILAEFDSINSEAEFSLEDFAKNFRNYFTSRVEEGAPSDHQKSITAFWIFGLDSLDSTPKVYRVVYPYKSDPELVIGGSAGFRFRWEGSGEPILSRMILGIDPKLYETIGSMKDLELKSRNEIVENLKGKFELSVNVQILSIDDAANFAESLIQIVHFLEKYAGTKQAVGPLSDVISISRRDGTRFIRGRNA